MKTNSIPKDFLFQSGNSFTIKIPKCKCLKDVEHDYENNPLFTLKVQVIQGEYLLYAYNSENGLVVLRDNSAIDKSYTVMEAFLSLKLQNDEESVNELKKYIEKYGFFFEIPKLILTDSDKFGVETVPHYQEFAYYDQFIKVNYQTLCRVLMRLKAQFFLIDINKSSNKHMSSQLAEKTYKSLISFIEYTPTIIEYENEILYKAPLHPYIELLETFRHIPMNLYNSAYAICEENGGLGKDFFNPDIRISFGIRYFDIKDTYLNNTVVKYIKYITDETECEDYYDIESKYDDCKTEFEKLKYLYYNYNDQYGISPRHFIDLLYHFIDDMHKKVLPLTITGRIDQFINIKKDELFTQMFLCGKYVIDESYSNLLLELAADTIKFEFDNVFKNIHPIYNIENMEAEWYIKDLFSAMYLSLLYTYSGQKIYRKCKLPSCRNFLIVSNTNSKRKYCDPYCRNIDCQNRYRKKHLNLKSEEEGGRAREGGADSVGRR